VAQDRTIRALMSLVDDLTVERHPDGLLQSTLNHVVKALDLSGGLTLLLDEHGELLPAAQSPRPSSDMELTSRLARRSLDRGRPAIEERAEGGWIAAAPLTTQDRALGVLTLHREGEDGVAPDLDLLEALGKQIGTGLDNARLYAELRASSARTEMLNRL